MAEMETIVKISDVSLRLKKHIILEHISVDFEKGKVHGLIGRNGSGKTMLMKCICGFIKVTEGSIEVNHKAVRKDIDFPESLGLIIETPGFIPYYSGYRNLKILSEPNGKIGKEEIRKTMELVGLDPYLHRTVGKYSLGMRQRLGIAQAVMENPDILVLDEPFNGLDKEGVEEIRKVFLRLKQEGKTIIIASHNGEDIRILCDTVHEMEKGKIINVKDLVRLRNEK